MEFLAIPFFVTLAPVLVVFITLRCVTTASKRRCAIKHYCNWPTRVWSYRRSCSESRVRPIASAAVRSC